MPRHKLTEVGIRAQTEPGLYGDGDGLWLRIQKGGSKSWVFIWRRGPVRREMGLGGYRNGTAPVSLALSREKADEVRNILARGGDPFTEATWRQRREKTTFAECMEALIAVKQSEWRNEKHAAQWRMTLREYAKPLHRLSVDEITVDDVVLTLKPHWAERPETADRLRSRIGAVMDYAKARGLRTTDNPAVWRGLLDKLLPARKKLTRGHHAALDYKAAPETLANLRKSKGTAARTVEFITLTAARSGEARNAVWSEFDMEDEVWTIPPERMKAGREHRVPLSVRVVAILREMRERSMDGYVFSGERGGRPISSTAMVKALRLAAPEGVKVTLHGLRSTFRDWAGNETNHPRDIAEAALAHTLESVERAYRRSDALAKRRSLMEDWAVYNEGNNG